MRIGLSKMKASMKEKDIPAVLVTDIKNVFYLSGYTGSSAYLIIDEEKNYIFTDFRYIEQAEKECPDFVIVDVKDTQIVDDILASYDVVGFEDVNISLSLFNKFRKKIKSLYPIGQMIYDIRAVKSADEIELIKKAQKITDHAFSYIVSYMKIGMSEREAALELEYYMRKNGASAVSFDIICASGVRGSLPHAEPTDKTFKEGELIVLDFGCVYNGYMSDMTRTVAVGKISDKAKDVYNTVLNAQTSAMSYIKPGACCADIHRVAENVINAKYPSSFGHGLGHSVGIEIHEMPSFSPKCDKILSEGNVLTVEPGIYLKGELGVRIEDMVVINHESYENITKSCKELIYIS